MPTRTSRRTKRDERQIVECKLSPRPDIKKPGHRPNHRPSTTSTPIIPSLNTWYDGKGSAPSSTIGGDDGSLCGLPQTLLNHTKRTIRSRSTRSFNCLRRQKSHQSLQLQSKCSCLPAALNTIKKRQLATR